MLYLTTTLYIYI